MRIVSRSYSVNKTYNNVRVSYVRDRHGRVIAINRINTPVTRSVPVKEYRDISVFGVVFAVLFFYAFVGVLSGRRFSLTFSGLLNAFADAPKLDFSLLSRFMDVAYIEKDWGLFNFLKDFINNFIINGLAIGQYFSYAIVQLFIYIVWFLRFIFVGG